MSDTHELITLEQVSIKRGVCSIVNQIDWTIHAQERWLLFGLNGCGKTTLLSAIAGYQGITKGVIQTDGAILDAQTRQTWRERSGFVSASFLNQYFQKESAIEIVLSGCFGGFGLRSSVSAEMVVAAKQLLRDLGLYKKHQYPYDVLSQGQRQKVLIARAIIARPDVLILDEPFNGLDILGRIQVQHLLDIWMQETGKTLILVTHHADEIIPGLTHAALMKNGRLHSAGSLEEIISTDNLSDFLSETVQVSWKDSKVTIELPSVP